jgi:acyl transferase domain-containing protein
MTTTRPKIAMLFTGQGSQYAGMGRELFETHRGFRRRLEHCEEILRGTLECPLLEVLYPPEQASDAQRQLIDQTAYTQPALFALEYALAELWQTWGIRPQLVIGHSAGEYVAACVAGVFSLEDGLRLIAARAPYAGVAAQRRHARAASARGLGAAHDRTSPRNRFACRSERAARRCNLRRTPGD